MAVRSDPPPRVSSGRRPPLPAGRPYPPVRSSERAADGRRSGASRGSALRAPPPARSPSRPRSPPGAPRPLSPRLCPPRPPSSRRLSSRRLSSRPLSSRRLSSRRLSSRRGRSSRPLHSVRRSGERPPSLDRSPRCGAPVPGRSYRDSDRVPSARRSCGRPPPPGAPRSAPRAGLSPLRGPADRRLSPSFVQPPPRCVPRGSPSRRSPRASSPRRSGRESVRRSPARGCGRSPLGCRSPLRRSPLDPARSLSRARRSARFTGSPLPALRSDHPLPTGRFPPPAGRPDVPRPAPPRRSLPERSLPAGEPLRSTRRGRSSPEPSAILTYR